MRFFGVSVGTTVAAAAGSSAGTLLLLLSMTMIRRRDGMERGVRMWVWRKFLGTGFKTYEAIV